MMDIQRPLFAMPASTTGVERGEWIDKGLSGRAKIRIALGKHPLDCVDIGLRLHPDASTDPEDHVNGPRCGACRFAVRSIWHNKQYNKCAFGIDPERQPLDEAPRAAHSEASDLRLRWPACTDFQPIQPEGAAR